MVDITPVLVLIIILAVDACLGTSIDGLCITNAHLRNYKELYPDPSGDCHFYYHCFYHNDTFTTAIRQQCPSGMFWGEQVLSCLPEAKGKQCQDACLDDAVSAKERFSGSGCRQFFQCANTASYAMCCPEGARFNESSTGCDYDPTCLDPCQMDAPLLSTTLAPPKQLSATVCEDSFQSRISLVPGERNAFFQLDLDGNPTEKMHCPESTSFNVVTCQCEFSDLDAVAPAKTSKRDPILWAKFDGSAKMVKDSSPSHFALFLEDSANLDTNGYLTVNQGYVAVPGMKSLDFGQSASFCASFRCGTNNCSKEGGILSNFKSENEFTVVLAIDSASNVVGKLHLWHPVGVQTVSARLSQTSADAWNNVCLTYDGNSIKLYLNKALVDSKFQSGFLTISGVQFEIGQDSHFGSFDGTITEVYVARFAMSQLEIEDVSFFPIANVPSPGGDDIVRLGDRENDRQKEDKIARGTLVQRGEFPFLVLIKITSEQAGGKGVTVICTGSLIRYDWVLTAAHCFYGKTIKIIQVYLGYTDVNKKNSDQEILLAVKLVMHEQLNLAIDADNVNARNDIALLQLNETVTPSKYIDTLTLPDKCQDPGENGNEVDGFTKAISAGWGRTGPESNRSSSIAFETEMMILPRTKCSSVIQHGLLIPGQICAAGKDNRNGTPTGTCKGDSGGPLFQKRHGKWTVLGLDSFGSGDGTCGVAGKVTVFTQVCPYINWITQHTKG